MTDTEERPTTQERYQRATQSSNLRPTRVGTTGDVDVIGAAGMVKSQLGLAMIRLMEEFGNVKGERDLYEVEVLRLRLEEQAVSGQIAAMRKAPKPDLARIAAKVEERDRLRDSAKREWATARAMVLGRLKSLREVQDCLYLVARDLAAEYRNPISDKDVAAVVGRVLDVQLDPTCHFCQGRSFNGGTHRGDPRIDCRHCKTSGNRRDSVGHTDDEKHLADRLMTLLSKKVANAGREMRESLTKMEREPDR